MGECVAMPAIMKTKKAMCSPIKMDLICVSFCGIESSEKVTTPSRLTGKTHMLETENTHPKKRGNNKCA